MKRYSKVLVGSGLGGAIATVAVWVARLQGIDMPAEVGAAIGALVIAVFTYFAPRNDETGEIERLRALVKEQT